jgi:hypothetical protein
MPMPTSLAPGYVRGTYDGVLFPHHMAVPVNFDGTPTPGTEPDILLKDASSTGVIAAFDALLDVIVPFFPTACNFGLFEAHTVDDVTGEDQFIFAWNAGRTGSSLVARVAMEQIVFSFKTSVGSAYKLYLMEAVEPVNQRALPPYTAPTNADLSDFIVGDASPVYGRQNAYPFVPVSFITKTNDKLRKQQGLA